jgi:hypothetical protein
MVLSQEIVQLHVVQVHKVLKGPSDQEGLRAHKVLRDPEEKRDWLDVKDLKVQKVLRVPLEVPVVMVVCPSI